MKQKVVIIGQGYTGRLSIVRSVAAWDCEITLIVLLPSALFEKKRRDRPIDSYSKYVSRTFYSENYNEKMLVEILLKQCADDRQKTFIFPDNDFSAAAVDDNRNVLKDFFYCPHVKDTQGEVGRWMDKVRQKSLAREVGLNVANSELLVVKNRKFQIPSNIKYPCFVKPLISIVGGKSGLKKCNDESDLRNHINVFLDSHRFDDVDFLVEDYIKIEREYATLGFSDGNEVVIPGLLELLQIGHESHFGVALFGRIFPSDGYEDIVNKFKSFVKEMGFVGVFDIDFFESKGIMYFCEMNLRFGGSGYAYTKQGVNLPIMLMKSTLGESIEGMKKTITQEASYFNERMAMDDWYSGYITEKEYFQLKSKANICFVENIEDPMPQRYLEKEFKVKKIKKTIKGWIGKK